jgi:hypothetical protein
VLLSDESRRPGHRISLALALAHTDRHARAVEEVESIAEHPDVRDNAQYLWNLAKVCSLALVSAAHQSPDRTTERASHEIEIYATKATDYLTRAKSAADKSLWSQLSAEVMTDKGFGPLRSRINIAPFVEPK